MHSRYALPIVLVALLEACGGSPAAGPSPVAPPAATMSAPSPAVAGGPRQPSKLPTVFSAPPIAALGLDPEYVRILVYTVRNDDGTSYEHPLSRWVGGPFHHCVDAGFDHGVIDGVAAYMSSLTGIPQTTAGPCNVRWTIDTSTAATVHHAYTTRHADADGIHSVEIVFPDADNVPPRSALHEAGHALGLEHSPKGGDLMAPTPLADDFSASEVQVLTAMYGR